MYTIRSGDTLWGIASKLQARGVKGTHQQLIAKIAAMNGIANPNLIMAGKSLKLPGASDSFDTGGGKGDSISPVVTDGASVNVDTGGQGADAFRAKVAQWAIAQADNPDIGYSQTKGRMGNATDSQGHRYFDCSGLVFSAYKQAGVKLGGDWTGAMRSTWHSWADEVPKKQSAMKPGDLILMNGHVVMYIGNGKCVGAQTSHTAFKDQVTTNIDAAHYLSRPDAIVLRPRVPAGLA